VRRTRRALLAAAVTLAALPAHASPFDLLPSGATMLGAWSFTGSRCGEDWLPGTYPTFGDVPIGVIGCIDGADLAIYRDANGIGGLHFRAPFHSPVNAGIYLFDAGGFISGFPYGSYPSATEITQVVTDIDDGALTAYLSTAGRPMDFVVVFNSAYWVDEDPTGMPSVTHTYASVSMAPVAITATPEPATLALVAAGVALVGIAARRRHRRHDR
jgi:hypothetical protein